MTATHCGKRNNRWYCYFDLDESRKIALTKRESDILDGIDAEHRKRKRSEMTAASTARLLAVMDAAEKRYEKRKGTTLCYPGI